MRRCQPLPSHRPVLQPIRPVRQHQRHQHHPDPCSKAGHDADGHRTRWRVRSPDREGQSRYQRGQGRKRHRTDIGQRAVSGHPLSVQPRRQHDRRDPATPQQQHQSTQIVASITAAGATHQPGCRPVVADHHAQGERADHDHPGCSAQTTEKAEQGQRLLPLHNGSASTYRSDDMPRPDNHASPRRDNRSIGSAISSMYS